MMVTSTGIHLTRPNSRVTPNWVPPQPSSVYPDHSQMEIWSWVNNWNFSLHQRRFFHKIFFTFEAGSSLSSSCGCVACDDTLDCRLDAQQFSSATRLNGNCLTMLVTFSGKLKYPTAGLVWNSVICAMNVECGVQNSFHERLFHLSIICSCFNLAKSLRNYFSCFKYLWPYDTCESCLVKMVQ